MMKSKLEAMVKAQMVAKENSDPEGDLEEGETSQLDDLKGLLTGKLNVPSMGAMMDPMGSMKNAMSGALGDVMGDPFEIPDDVDVDALPKDMSEVYEGAVEYAKDFALALIPSPTNLADMYSKSSEPSEGSAGENIIGNAKRSGALDWFTKQRLTGRRPSFTAQSCQGKGCNRLHFGTSLYCIEHDEAEAKVISFWLLTLTITPVLPDAPC